MASNGELAHQALFDALNAALPHNVFRNLKEDLGAHQLPATVVRDGTADVTDETVNLDRFWFSEQVTLEYSSLEEDPDAQAVLVDAWAVAVNAGLADRTLGLPGVVDGVDLAPPIKTVDDIEGASDLTSGQITATLRWNSDSPTG